MEVGRRGGWGCEIKRLLGTDIFNHVIYYDTVGCSHSGRLQRVVVTDRHLYLYNDNTKTKPEPLCELLEITDLDADHETPEAYHNHRDYDSHHIFFNIGDRQYHLYTFEPGTDLYWRLRNAVENAARAYGNPRTQKKDMAQGHIRLVRDGGKEIPEHSYYTQLFNQISSRVVHAGSHRARMAAINELEDISHKYFNTRTIFFQSSTLISYLMDTLTYFSDFHTVPTQIKSSRLEQVELICSIFKTISYYLEGSSTVRDAMKLITYNKGCHYRILIKSLFQTEWFILSQPNRTGFFLQSVKESQQEQYLAFLQETENVGVSICSQLYQLGVLGWRTLNNDIEKDYFLNVILEDHKMILNGGFHTIVFMLIQMCYAMPSMTPVNMIFCHSFYDHLWLVNFFVMNIPGAIGVITSDFISEFDVIVTEERMKKCIPADFKLYKEILKLLGTIKAAIKRRPPTAANRGIQPVMFK